MNVVDQIFNWFRIKGKAAYFGEAVSQEEHALQAAYLAEREGASDGLVVAALLHDVGHLLHGLSEDVARRGVDARHEDVGEAFLSQHFGDEVTEPVKLHVAAKRYLCAVDPNYLNQLSPASMQSLRLQGGAFSLKEVKQFEQNPYYREAVRLRRWDDAAKVAGLPVPGLERYRARMEKVLIKSLIQSQS